MTRLKRLQKFLQSKHIPAYLIFNQTNIFYLTDSSGLLNQHSQALLLVTPKLTHLFLSPLISPPQNPQINTIILKKSKKYPHALNQVLNPHLKNLYLEKDSLKHSAFLNLQKKLNCHLKLKKDLLIPSRTIKDKSELKNIKKACLLVDQALAFIKPHLKLGKTEIQLAWLLEQFLRLNGSQALPFPPIVAIGKNSAIPHHQPTDKKLKKTDLVLIDIGATINGYHSDITRVFFLNSPSLKQIKIYQHVLTAQKQAFKKLNLAKRYFKSQKLFKYFPHNLGHGLGLDIHEAPNLSKAKLKIKSQTVFTIEPGLYFKNQFGIRLEDTVVQTKSGPKALTKFPKSLKSATI